MNFHQGAITKYLILGTPSDELFQPYPLTFNDDSGNVPRYPSAKWTDEDAEGVPGTNYAGWNMGRFVNLVFDTPNWPVSAAQVTVQAISTGTTAGSKPPLLVAVNSMIQDSNFESGTTYSRPYPTFLRGNPVYTNGKFYNSSTDLYTNATYATGKSSTEAIRYSLSQLATPGCTSVGEVRIVYSAVLKNIVPSGVRLNVDASRVVQPTDTIEIVSPQIIVSNAAVANRITAYDGAMSGVPSINPHPIITALKKSSTAGGWTIEFSALVNNSNPEISGNDYDFPAYTGLGSMTNSIGPGTSVTTSYTANELYFYCGVDAANANIIKGLARDAVAANVIGRDIAGNIVFTGSIANAANLTHVRNNTASILSRFNDPDKYSHYSNAEFASGARPIKVCFSSTQVQTPDNTFTFTAGIDSSGSQPLKSLSVYNPSSTETMLIVTVIPQF